MPAGRFFRGLLFCPLWKMPADLTIVLVTRTRYIKKLLDQGQEKIANQSKENIYFWWVTQCWVRSSNVLAVGAVDCL